MKHGVSGRHFSRPTGHRLAMYRNLVADLIRHERITTTEAKAKEIRPMAERVITAGKKDDYNARRTVQSAVGSKEVVEKLFKEIGPRYSARNGGYTRILKLSPRLGDRAQMAIIELLK